jgi:glycosyltransferase involved in cell wall biosynthesis
LNALKRKLNITHSISFMEGADMLNILSRLGTEKIITSIRGSILHDEDRALGWLGKMKLYWLLPQLYYRADIVVPVSEGIKKEMVDKMGIPSHRIHTIYNYYNLSEYTSLLGAGIESDLDVLLQTFPVVIAVGRIERQKNFTSLVPILKRIKKEIPEAKMIIIGTGTEMSQVTALATSAGLTICHYSEGQADRSSNADLILLGYRANPHAYVARAGVFLMPSRWEGFPNVLAEAMLVGVPCIAADCPTGPSEIIGNRPCGIVLPTPEVEQQFAVWASAAVHLLRNPVEARKLAEAGTQRMLDFNPANIIPQWLDLLHT